MTETLNERQIEDREFIENSNQWPNWPVLPIKRYTKKFELPECGFIMDVSGFGGKSLVYLCNLFKVTSGETKLDEVPTLQYSDVKEMLLDGWMVD